MGVQPIVLIVDPFSAGNRYAEVFRGLGMCDIFAVLSHHPINPQLFSSFIANDFAGRILKPTGEKFQDDDLGSRVLDLIAARREVIVVPGCETGVILADRLVDRFKACGLKALGNDVQTSDVRRNKFLMGEKLRAAGLRSIDHALCENVEDAIDWCKAQRLEECFVKPVDSGGSDKVRRCPAIRDKLQFAIDDILGNINVTGTRNTAALVQECVDGVEYVVDHVSFHGKHHTTAAFRYEKRLGPDNSILYDTMWLVEPASDVVEMLTAYTRKVLDALDIKFGPSHAELMLDKSGPVLIEVGARPHGGIGGPFITRKCCGANQLFHTALFLGRSVNSLLAEMYRPSRFGVELFLANPAARLAEKFPFEEFERLKTCATAMFFRRPGEEMPATIDLQTSPGRIVLISRDQLDLHEDLNRARAIAERYFAACPLSDRH